ncbi:hypothetical protein VTN77DRAFT_6509 [Rasamsonia byssochlamydoides]|uniref:uncharacterized protein n=1 Tax=Rasamsonia byssochlamydoides TaxID=89139 RepID=UPI0037427CB9
MLLRCLVPLLLWQLAAAITLPDSYNVVWTTQSRNSSESMPLGGGDLGLNVWAENGTILFYIAKSGTFDDNNSLVKLGLVRLTLEPDPFVDQFSQTLLLNDGYIVFTGRNDTTVTLWVNAFNPVVHTSINSSVPLSLTASYESWRYRDCLMGENGTIYEQDQSSWDQLPGANATTRADNITFYNGGVLMTHRNLPTTVFDYTVREQGLEQYKDVMYIRLRIIL